MSGRLRDRRVVLSIGDTGHFNSVEFNICYNQLIYYLIAKSVQEGLLPALRGWTLDDFWRSQLPDILITNFSSSFKRKMRGKRFFGSGVGVADDRASRRVRLVAVADRAAHVVPVLGRG